MRHGAAVSHLDALVLRACCPVRPPSPSDLASLSWLDRSAPPPPAGTMQGASLLNLAQLSPPPRHEGFLTGLAALCPGRHVKPVAGAEEAEWTWQARPMMQRESMR